jgi:hypothetical protein
LLNNLSLHQVIHFHLWEKPLLLEEHLEEPQEEFLLLEEHLLLGLSQDQPQQEPLLWDQSLLRTLIWEEESLLREGDPVWDLVQLMVHYLVVLEVLLLLEVQWSLLNSWPLILQDQVALWV